MNKNTRIAQMMRNKAKDGLSYSDVVSSDYFTSLINQSVKFITESNKSLRVILVKNEPFVAVTNGKEIFFNVTNDITNSFPNVDLMIKSALGFIYHELGHLLYTDFELRENFLSEINKTGKFLSAYEDKTTMKEVQQYIRKYPSMKRIIAETMANITNIVEDIFIESMLSSVYKGTVKNCLAIDRQRMCEKGETLSEMLQKNYSHQAIFLNLLIQQASCGSYNNWQRLNNQYTDVIDKVSPIVNRAVRSLTQQGRLNKSTDIFLASWEIMKDEIDDLINRIKIEDGEETDNGGSAHDNNLAPPKEGDINVNKNAKGSQDDSGASPQVIDALINDLLEKQAEETQSTSEDNDVEENSDLFKGKEPTKKQKDSLEEETSNNENDTTDTTSNTSDNSDTTDKSSKEDSNASNAAQSNDMSDGEETGDSSFAETDEDTKSSTGSSDGDSNNREENSTSETATTNNTDTIDEEYSDGANGTDEDFDYSDGTDGADEDFDYSDGTDGADEDFDYSDGTDGADEDFDYSDGTDDDFEMPNIPANGECENDGLLNSEDSLNNENASDGINHTEPSNSGPEGKKNAKDTSEALEEATNENDNSEPNNLEPSTENGDEQSVASGVDNEISQIIDESENYDIEDDEADLDTLSDELERLRENDEGVAESRDEEGVVENMVDDYINKTEPVNDGLSEALKRMVDEVASENVEKELLSESERQLREASENVELGDMHKKCNIKVDRHKNVTEADVNNYNSVCAEPQKTAKILTRKMEKILKIKQEGVEKNVIFGKRLSKTPYNRQGKIFNKRHLPNETDLAVLLLIDQSGSMSGQRRNMSVIASIVLQNFCESLNIPLQIAGHRVLNDVRYDVFKDFEETDGRDKYRLMQIAASGGNRDGAALLFAGDLLLKRPERNKLLILISDGAPADTNYWGEEAEADLFNIKKKLQGKGLTLFAAAIGDDKEQIKRIYKDNYLDISDLNMLPTNMVRLVERFIK